jgi:hypothetical protein
MIRRAMPVSKRQTYILRGRTRALSSRMRITATCQPPPPPPIYDCNAINTRYSYVPPQNPEDASPRFFAAVRLADSDSRNGAAAVKRRYQKRISDEPSSTNKRVAALEQHKSRKKPKLPTPEAVRHYLMYTSQFSEEDKQQMWPGGTCTDLRGKCSGCNRMVRSVCCCSRTTWLCGKSCFSQHVSSALFVDDDK